MTQVFDRRKGHLNLDSESVTLANLQPIESNRMLGRVSAGIGPVEALSVPQVRGLLYTEGTNITITDGVISASSNSITHYEAVVTGTFNENVVYVDGSNKVPDFVVDESGDIVYAEVYN